MDHTPSSELNQNAILLAKQCIQQSTGPNSYGSKPDTQTPPNSTSVDPETPAKMVNIAKPPKTGFNVFPK